MNFIIEDASKYVGTGVDATAFVQWCVDNDKPIPYGEYYIRGTIIFQTFTNE